MTESNKNKNTLPIIQSLWIGKELSIMEQLSVTSFLRNGHPFHLYVYDDVKNVPEGVVLKDAHAVINRSEVFKYKDHDSYAGFSNEFRYKLLLEKGSYWVDTDVVCIKPLPTKPEYLFASEKVRKTDPFQMQRYQLASCVMKVPSGSQIMDYCYREAVKRDRNTLLWGETGPKLVTSAVNQFGMKCYMTSHMTFCPINWWEWRRAINGSFIINWKENIKMALHRSSAIHLWNEMWRRNKIDKNLDHPSNSIYEQLKQRYL